MNIIFQLSDELYYTSIIGGVVVVIGLYLVVWGKAKEQKHLMPPSPEKVTLQRQQQLPVTVPISDDANDNNKAQLVIIGDRKDDVEARTTTVNLCGP